MIRAKQKIVLYFHLKIRIVSKIQVKNMDKALYYCNKFGPAFSTDLLLHVKDLLANFNRFNQQYYEKKIGETEDEFLIEDYEVFQIIKNYV